MSENKKGTVMSDVRSGAIPGSFTAGWQHRKVHMRQYLGKSPGPAMLRSYSRNDEQSMLKII